MKCPHCLVGTIHPSNNSQYEHTCIGGCRRGWKILKEGNTEYWLALFDAGKTVYEIKKGIPLKRFIHGELHEKLWDKYQAILKEASGG